jgi:putative hydrolase of the HAD superfamily
LNVLDAVTPEAIIFDLGGVIVDIDVTKTYNDFMGYSGREHLSAEDFYSNSLLFDFEKGKINVEEFLVGLAGILNSSVEKEQLVKSWNSMIVDIPHDRLMLVNKIRNYVPVLAFSNTNALHINHLNNLLLTKHGHSNLNSFFTKTFYSHEIGQRKPDLESFEWVIREGEMEGKNVLFLDDNISNIIAAEKAGIKGWHITSPDEWIDYFSKWMK